MNKQKDVLFNLLTKIQWQLTINIKIIWNDLSIEWIKSPTKTSFRIKNILTACTFNLLHKA